MTKPAAKKGDAVIGTDMHVLVGPGQPTTPVPLPFAGELDTELSPDVLIEHRPAATVRSVATNKPAHIAPPGASFQRPPSNQGTVVAGSGTVLINHRAAARNGDRVETCNDPQDAPNGAIECSSTVRIAD
ncbi:MAG: PAAR domain-containing protein [Polyangiaceae bacterium]